MTGVAKLFDGHILNKLNEEINLNDEKYKEKIIGLFFCGQWCPPCRRLAPILIEFYKKYSKEKNFEIIFISTDNDEDSFNEYYKIMPWLKLDYQEEEKKDELIHKFNVNRIPKLILLDGDSADIICSDASDQFKLRDINGNKFPWKLN